ASNTFVPAGSLVARHKNHTATLLVDGSVLIAGGFGQSWMTGQTAEFYDPATALSLSPGVLANANTGVAYSATLTISGGTAPYTIDMVSGVLPSGITFNAATRTLAGT